MILGSAAVALSAILRGLSKQLCLEREDVVQNPIDAPALEAMVGDDAGPFEVSPQRRPQWPVDARTTCNLGFLQKLEAAVQRKLAKPVLSNRHLGPQHLHSAGRGDANLDLVEGRKRVGRAARFAVVRERDRVAGTLEQA